MGWDETHLRRSWFLGICKCRFERLAYGMEPYHIGSNMAYSWWCSQILPTGFECELLIPCKAVFHFSSSGKKIYLWKSNSFTNFRWALNHYQNKFTSLLMLVKYDGLWLPRFTIDLHSIYTNLIDLSHYQITANKKKSNILVFETQ